MQEAVPVGIGAMAALLGLDFETATLVAAEGRRRPRWLGDLSRRPNDNDPGAGWLCQAIKARGTCAGDRQGARSQTGAVAAGLAPFHCALMEPAAAVMGEALAGVVVKAPSIRLW